MAFQCAASPYYAGDLGGPQTDKTNFRVWNLPKNIPLNAALYGPFANAFKFAAVSSGGFAVFRSGFVERVCHLPRRFRRTGLSSFAAVSLGGFAFVRGSSAVFCIGLLVRGLLVFGNASSPAAVSLGGLVSLGGIAFARVFLCSALKVRVGRGGGRGEGSQG